MFCHALDECEVEWNIVEVLSFGDFIKLYQLYYEKYKSKSNFSKSIFPISLLRNAAAHNNCLLNSLAKPYSIEIDANEQLTRIVSKIPGVGKREHRNKMSNPVIHDLTLLLFLFNKIVESQGTREKTYRKLKSLVDERIPRHKEYFLQNQALVTSYQFVKKVVDFFAEDSVK